MKKSNTMVLSLTIVYVILMVWIILFKMSTITELSTLDHIRKINLIPFYYEQEVSFHFSEVLNNVAIFIPLGIYCRMLGINVKKTILLALCLSLAFELTQYIIGIGATDITDAITNTAGAAIGSGIYGFLTIIFKSAERVEKILSVIAMNFTIMFIVLVTIILCMN